ncbi:MAG: ComEC family competence protein [Rhodospirillales bacterium]|nr:ComEC family competence protein [Rhodospirillales bacterium]
MMLTMRGYARRFSLPDDWQAAVHEAIGAQKDNILLWLPLFTGGGIGLYFSLPFEPPLALALSLWFLITALWLLIWPLRHEGGRQMAGWLVLCFLFFLVSGFMAAQIRTALMHAPVLERDLSPVEIEGTVIDIDRLEPGAGSRVILTDLVIEKLRPAETPRKVRIKIHKDEGLKTGMRLRVLAGLNPPSAPVAPRAFDFQFYAYFKQIGAFGFAYDAPEALAVPSKTGFAGTVEALRQGIVNRIEAQIPYPQASFAAALMTGERAAITEEDWEAIRAAGLAHMLAISGLHIGMVAGLLFFISRFVMALIPVLALHYPIKKYAAAFAFAGALGYTILAGANVPTLRALFMTGLVLFAIIIDRMPFSMRTVALAALVILLSAPEALFSAGFQMSFAAVTALVFFFEVIRPWWSRLYRGAGWGRRVLMYFLGVLLTTLVAGSAVAPFSLFHFQQYPVYDLPANLLAGPLMAFVIMPSVVFSFFLMPLGIEFPAFWALDMGITGLLAIARDVAALPNATVNPPVWPGLALLCLVLGVLWAMLWRGRGKILALVFVGMAGAIIMQARVPDVLVASSGKLIAVNRGADGWFVSSRVRDRFSAENWARLYGQDYETLGRFPKEGTADGITCGEWGCRMVLKGRHIAFSDHENGQAEDCAWADVLIARDPLRVKPCRAGLVIDRFDLWDNGAYALYVPDDPSALPRAESVASVRGARPWVSSSRR